MQEYAKEALDTLHAAPGTQTTSSFTSSGLGGGGGGVGASGKRMQGFGNDSGSGVSSSGMMGFGSDSIGYQYGSGSGDLSSNTAPYRAPISGGPGLDLSSGTAVLESLSYGVRDFTDRAVEALSRPEHQRLNSVDSEDSGHGYGIHSTSTNIGGGGGGHRAPVMLDRSPGSFPSSTTTSSSHHQQQQQQYQSREYLLVERICTPSGMRAAPSTEDLNIFIDATVNVDGVELAVALQHKLEIGSWQETLRALCAIEALLEKSAASPTAGEVAVHFQAGVSVIRRAQQSSQATVRQRAQRVLRLLGADTLPEEGNLSGSKSGAARGTIDLLGDGLDGGDNILGASNSTSGNGNAMDLLAGLNVAPEQSGGSDVFGDWADSTAIPAAAAPAVAVVAPSSQQQSSVGGVDLLDALTDLSLSQPSAAAMHTTGPLDDIFSMPSPAATTTTATTTITASDPFGNGLGTSEMHQPSVGNYMSYSTGGNSTAGQPQPSLGSGGVNDDVLRAINAATSGITSTKREEVAFDFVTTAMAELKTKK